MQNDFVADGGFFANRGADVGSIQTSVMPRLQSLIAAARDAGVLVVFVQAVYDEQYLSAPMRERNIRVGATESRCSLEAGVLVFSQFVRCRVSRW